MPENYEVKINKNQDKCDHVGKWFSIGHLMVPFKKFVQVLTITCCGKCGANLYASQKMELDEEPTIAAANTKIKLPN